jgi:2-iminobutanoate/2-iminopropanoate deaminase
MEIRPVQTPNAPEPAGHYSQAIIYGGIVYVSGQLAIDPQTGEKQLGSIEAQTEQTLKNVGEVLKACDSDLGRVLKMTIYISDMGLWGAVNSVYARVMGAHRPARAVVPVKDLHHGFQIEIEAIAATRGPREPGA